MTQKLTGMTPAMLAAQATGLGMMAGTPGAILAQEADGQADLVQGPQKLPLDLRPPQEMWQAAGFTFGELIDSLFRSATYPAGWKLEPTSHSMHSEILDAQGRRRGGVFYKAAFYDQKAHGWLDSRYYTKSLYCDNPSVPPEHTQTAVWDAAEGKAVKTFGEPLGWGPETVGEDQRRRTEANAWLDATYPDHMNPAAYWD